jgi:hypothetical protein
MRKLIYCFVLTLYKGRRLLRPAGRAGGQQRPRDCAPHEQGKAEPHHVLLQALPRRHRLHPHQQAGAPAQRRWLHPAGRPQGRVGNKNPPKKKKKTPPKKTH